VRRALILFGNVLLGGLLGGFMPNWPAAFFLGCLIGLIGLIGARLFDRGPELAPIPWAGNARERAMKRRGWGFYASHIGSEGSVYMRRFIFLLPFGLGTIRLHNIMRSDDDRHLHDHPFDFVSFLLTGGYLETLPVYSDDGRLLDPQHTSTRKTWPRFSIIRKRAEDLHALTLERPVWTLVFAGPKRRDWGFATERGWISNHRYLDEFPLRAEWRDQPVVSR